MARSTSAGENISELWNLLKSYAVQETIDPLRGLKGYVPRGLAAATFTTLGLGLVLLGILRLIQYEGRDWNSNYLSIVGYLAVLIVAGSALFIMAWRIPRAFRDRDDR